MDGPLVGPDPSELGILGEVTPEGAGIIGELIEGPTHHQVLMGPDGGTDDLVATSDREGGPMPFEASADQEPKTA